VAAVAITTFALTRSSPISTVDRCVDEAARVDRTWNPAARDRVSKALLASGKPYAPVAATRATSAFDRWSNEWRDARLSSCHDADRGALAEKDWRGVSSCLDDALADADSRVEVLASDRAAIEHIGDVVELSPPKTCTRVGIEAPPDDPALAAKVAAAREELRALDALGDVGRYADEAPRARVLLARVRALGWRPLIDDVAFALAWVDLDLGATAEADPLIREVAQSAAVRGDDLLVGRAGLTQIRRMTATRRFDGLDFVASSTRASYQRLHMERSLLVLDAYVGQAELTRGHVAEAKKLCETALGKVDATMSIFSIRAELLDCLALAAQAERRPDEQLRYAGLLLDERIRLVGPRHPVVAEVVLQIASVLESVGRTRDALVLELAGHALVEESVGPDSPALAGSWAQIARLRATLHDAKGARAAIDRASAIVGNTTVAGDRERDEVMRARAEVLGELGDAEGAVAALGTLAADVAKDEPGTAEDFASAVAYAQVLEQVHRCPDAVATLDGAIARGTSLAPSQRFILLAVKANCQLELGHAKDAARELGDAWAKLDPSTLAPNDRGMMTYTLAQAYEGAGDRARALEFARKARLDVVATESLADYLPSVDHLIQRNGGGPPPHAPTAPDR
jgi:serine/threonine-protein kinase